MPVFSKPTGARFVTNIFIGHQDPKDSSHDDDGSAASVASSKPGDLLDNIHDRLDNLEAFSLNLKRLTTLLAKDVKGDLEKLRSNFEKAPHEKEDEDAATPFAPDDIYTFARLEREIASVKEAIESLTVAVVSEQSKKSTTSSPAKTKNPPCAIQEMMKMMNDKKGEVTPANTKNKIGSPFSYETGMSGDMSPDSYATGDSMSADIAGPDGIVGPHTGFYHITQPTINGKPNPKAAIAKANREKKKQQAEESKKKAAEEIKKAGVMDEDETQKKLTEKEKEAIEELFKKNTGNTGNVKVFENGTVRVTSAKSPPSDDGNESAVVVE